MPRVLSSFLALILVLGAAAPLAAQNAEEARVNAVAYFSLTIGAISEGNTAAARQAATIGRDAAKEALRLSSEDRAAMNDIYNSLAAYLGMGVLEYGGAEFSRTGVTFTLESGMVATGSYAAFAKLVEKATQPFEIILEEHPEWDNPWSEIFSEGSQSSNDCSDMAIQGWWDGIGEMEGCVPRNAKWVFLFEPL
jgi:hypothetical protein